MPPNILTPDQLKESVTTIKDSKSGVKIMNKTLNDVNEVLKTIESISEKLGFNLKEALSQKKNEEPSGVAQKIQSGVEKQIAEIHKNNPEATMKGELHIAVQQMKTDLKKLLVDKKEEFGKVTLEEFIEFYNGWEKLGLVEGFIENTIKSYVTIK